MLSDLSYSTLPVDMSTPSTHLEEDPLAPLNFDELLDIAREFEFTRTITHIWPCEEDPSTCHEPMGLEDILAAIVPTPNAEEILLPLPSSALPMTLDPVHVQEIGLYRSKSMCPVSDVNASISRHPVPPSNNDQVQAEVEPPITSILRGWSPPNGSQFLDLDDNLMIPQSPRDEWISPWLASFLAPSCTQPASRISQSSAMVPVVGDVQPQTAEPKAPPASMTENTVDDPRKKSVPFVPLPVQLSTRVILEPVRARSALQTNSNVPSQTAIIPPAKTPKSRPRLPSTLATSGASTGRYAQAPRGGIPPHIARTVTKANILLVEKERKVMRDTFSSTTMGEGRKPSVLRRAAKVERETSKTVGGGGSGKRLFACGENDKKEGRAAKRARV
ncbi:hypothetical protein J3R82DRAFT_8198 [Butyriboletus roseoflavus]|nr:hypothetical protein J3R82DRAFT_8198 [Butyriboletus roseoflavus]